MNSLSPPPLSLLSTLSRSLFLLLSSQPMFQPDASPDIAGMLHKKGRRLKVWKQRYFEVQGTNMYYFKNEKVKIAHSD